MFYLHALEWAIGTFTIVFVVWTIVLPLLQGKVPFAKNTNEGEKK